MSTLFCFWWISILLNIVCGCLGMFLKHVVPISHNITLESFPEACHAFKSKEMFPVNILYSVNHIRACITPTTGRRLQFLAHQKNSLHTGQFTRYRLKQLMALCECLFFLQVVLNNSSRIIY